MPGATSNRTAVGCRMKALENRTLAATETNSQVRAWLESKAATWSARADLIERLEASAPAPEEP